MQVVERRDSYAPSSPSRSPQPSPPLPEGDAAARAGAWAFVLVAGAVVVALLLGLVASAGTLFRGAVTTTRAPLALPPLDESSVVYAGDGSVAAVLHADQDRKAVALGDVAPAFVAAVVDTEDVRFWQHGAVDARGIVRALGANASAGAIRQGGSTIAQQLAKITLLSSKQDLGRKVKEVVVAKRLLHELGHAGVLERYLNTVYFGNGAYGVEAAARRYFGVGAHDVNPAQAALLAGIIHDPDGGDPIRHPDAARARRATVLDLMAAHHDLPPADVAAARDAPVPIALVAAPAVQDFFTDAVKNELLADPRLGATPQERYHAVFAGGLQIHTTLDPAAQQAARDAVAHGLPHASMPLSAAVVAIDPSNGEIRALVGGAEYINAGFNPAIDGQGRQPGSSFKPFTLIAALEKGFSPKDTISGASPCSIPNPGGTPDPWRPANFEGEAFGTVTLSDAMVHSVNCAYARLALIVGLHQIADVAHRMGITAPLAEVPSMTLGTNVVTPLQMASAYATIAARGVYHKPHLIRSVAGPDGKQLFGEEIESHRAISENVAATATQVLQQVVRRGTGTAAGVSGHAIAGKTGTAEDYHDAWFVGFSPELAAAVWMGDPEGEVPMRNVAGINVQGGSFPARMWHAFMSKALPPGGGRDFPSAPPVPRGVNLRDGYGRDGKRLPGAAGGAAGKSTTNGTTWCSASCGRPGSAKPGSKQP